MTQRAKTTKRGTEVITSVDEFEALYFPRAYRERLFNHEKEAPDLDLAADFLAEVQRRLPTTPRAVR